MSYLRFSALTKSHHYFVCSCIPLHTFDYTYRYLLYSNVSFIERYITLSKQKQKFDFSSNTHWPKLNYLSVSQVLWIRVHMEPVDIWNTCYQKSPRKILERVLR